MKFDKELAFSTPKENEGIITKEEVINRNLSCFDDDEIYFILDNLSEMPRFKTKEDVKKFRIKLVQQYSHLDNHIQEEKLDYDLINETKHWLEEYSDSYTCYLKAIKFYQIGYFERNLLDELRLSLELLLKELFKNNKSLENQKSEIGKLVNSSGGSKEYTNMFITLNNYYKDYQNTYVKHDNNVNPNEVEFIVELTSSLMKQILKMYK